MRIAFDARALASPAGGVRRYVSELYAAIVRIAPETQLVAVGGSPADARLVGAEHVPVTPALPTNLGYAVSSLPWALRRVGFDVFHAPAYTSPLAGGRPLVLTIHDVSYERAPQWYPHRVDRLRRAFFRHSARRADRILTDSRFSRDEIAAAYQIPLGRIDVVPLAAAPAFTPDPRRPREPFVLHVGDLHPRRNLAMLLDVVIELRRADAALRGIRLVLAGVDRGSLASLRRQAAAAGADDALDYRGAVDADELLRLYRTAAVFAYPSRYEGFGLPVLEAMACAAPVVGSSAASVPEVLGDASRAIAPDDAGGWSRAIAHLLRNPAAATEASARGLARAAQFSWDHTARATLASMKTAVAARTARG